MVSKLCYLQPFKANRPTEDGIEVTFDCRRNVDPLKVRRRQRQHPSLLYLNSRAILGTHGELVSSRISRPPTRKGIYSRSIDPCPGGRVLDHRTPTIQATLTVRAIDGAETDGNGVFVVQEWDFRAPALRMRWFRLSVGCVQ